MEMENWSSGDNKPSMQQPEKKHDDTKPLMKVKTSGLSPSSSPLSSPTSSESSSLELSNSRKDPLGDADASLSSPDHVPNQTPQWSMISASPRGEEPPQFPDFFPQNPEWNVANPGPMKSPPTHNNNMGHPPGYDPNRIPSSIFSSKPNSSGMEWSTASNESLFSIHMGNNSFSRDQFNMMYRSGELLKPEEWSNSPYNNAPDVKSNDKKNLPPNLPPLVEMAKDKEVKSETKMESPRMQEKIIESENHENNIKVNKTSNVDEVQHSPSALNKSDELLHSASTLNKSDGKAVSQFEASYASSPRLSNESGNSSSSFAFPLLLNDAGKTGSLKAPSAKMERPQPQPQHQHQPQPHPHPQPQPQPQPKYEPDSEPQMQPQSPQQSESYTKSESKQAESLPKLGATSWFSCFSCWPRCC
ncbi:uncharacterized protein [Solanum lycopersicum]|uniref:Uncharacterized protein n=1 Tax=Solanum lycopersicum TaxID=4081 RepID=A0A3Q7FAW5_SOLLC|nr:uncharacterized protein DDB_G0292186 [Solanum lycopersicum]XP_019068003.1 uncharacterized protein DDB_G0292186 [Solanum lycopersicum]XP_019068004.1 uncharacterized protein DDB_G0292186 [Solanum lycopersicum]